jgi:predicted O-linked N-acetylglucosamine transferase (SPINDLY family)
VKPAQIELRGWSSYDQMLAEYNEIDLSLDPNPFCGATTTCEALWMGVPVVTCPMQTFASRQTLSILSNIGLTDTVASDPSHYVQLAVKMASNLPHLAELRLRLRQQMAESPLCDASRFAASFMQATRDIWRRWCQMEG